jgi:hypothetical protein
MSNGRVRASGRGTAQLLDGRPVRASLALPMHELSCSECGAKLRGWHYLVPAPRKRGSWPTPEACA